MTRQESREILSRLGQNCNSPADFHSLSNETVYMLLDFADLHKYRKPTDANGSRGRYFYQMLCRKSRQQEG